MYILPAIDLRQEKVVRLLQGDYDRQIDYGDDPLAVAIRFQQQGARWLHVVDLDGARSGEPANTEVIERIVRTTELRVEVGGGVRTAEDVARLLGLGVERVIMGTAALTDWPWFAELTTKPAFARKIMLGLDARDGRLAVDGWTEQTALTAVQVARRSDALQLAGIVYTDIATDGMMAGPNLAAMTEMVAATRHPVIASGGVSSIDDVRNLAQVPVAGAIIGRALYEGRIDLPAALATAKEHSRPPRP